MSISTSSFHQEKEAHIGKKQKMGDGSEAAEDMDLGEQTKNCDNCGKIGDHWTKDCRSGIYGRSRKYDQNTIRFRNLSEDTHRDQLYWLCSNYGTVARAAGPEIKGMKDQGLVAFENKKDAQMAIEKLNGSTYKGREENVPNLQENKCRHCGKIGEHWDKHCPLVVFNPTIGKYVHSTLHFRNFAGDTDRSDISWLCRNFGEVACVFEPGMYFEGDVGLAVAFENKEDAQKAIQKLNGLLYKGRVITVEWAKKKN
ncbi:hypothetical protein MKW92_043701 [Papaver armeniacum]|nr:hypothetical protein MKW92_043701 [Papaver armeniacum]